MSAPFDDRDGYVDMFLVRTTYEVLTWRLSSFEMNATLYQVRNSNMIYGVIPG